MKKRYRSILKELEKSKLQILKEYTEICVEKRRKLWIC